VREVEDFIFGQMRQKMVEFQTLTGGHSTKANPKLKKLNLELAQVEAEIEKLINTLMGANAVLLSYANTKVEELDEKRQSLLLAIADMTAAALPPEKIAQISGYLDDWANVSFDDKREVLDGLVVSIKATSEKALIEWKI
jgi:hypothetical protein